MTAAAMDIMLLNDFMPLETSLTIFCIVTDLETSTVTTLSGPINTRLLTHSFH